MRFPARRIEFKSSLVSRNFMSTALETESEFAVVLLTQDGTIVDAHANCLESLGWTREELVGKDIGGLLQSDRELLMMQLLQSRDEELGVDGQTSFSIRILARRRDETSFPARVVVRRFDQTECCTAAFYRVTPYNDSDTPPIVRAEEIELAMRGNAERPSLTANAQKAEKPKSRWRNARLLFGSRQPAEPAPAPEPPQPAKSFQAAPPPPPARSAPALDSRVPDTIFLRKNSTAPEPPAQPAGAKAPAPEAEVQVQAVQPEEAAAAILAPARADFKEQPVEPSANPGEENASIETLLRELEQEREERRRLEQRATTLTSQVSALHLQVSENLEIESRNQKKVNTLEEQLREARNQVIQLKSDVAAEREKSIAAQERIDAATAVSTHLAEQLEALQLVHDALTRTQTESENQLQAVNSELRDAQQALAGETRKSHELEQSVTAARNERAEEERKLRLELSKLETAVKAKELEIKELQTKAAQAQLQAK